MGLVKRMLKPSGRVTIQLNATNVVESQSELRMACLMAGLVESRVEENPSTKGWIYDEFVEIHALKPDFETGSKAALRSGSRPTTKWQVVVDEFDDETIDEDTLLDESEQVIQPRDDCEVGKGGKRRACKDCTCGRKDMENGPPVQLSTEEMEQMTSSCGNVSASIYLKGWADPKTTCSATRVMHFDVVVAPTWANRPSSPEQVW